MPEIEPDKCIAESEATPADVVEHADVWIVECGGGRLLTPPCADSRRYLPKGQAYPMIKHVRGEPKSLSLFLKTA